MIRPPPLPSRDELLRRHAAGELDEAAIEGPDGDGLWWLSWRDGRWRHVVSLGSREPKRKRPAG